MDAPQALDMLLSGPEGILQWNATRARELPRSMPRLCGLDLRGAALREADLSFVDLTGSLLEKADFTRVNLSYSTLARVELASADLSSATLVNTDLTGASLRGTRLVSSRIDGCDLEGSDLEGAILGATGILSSLAGCKGLDQTLHRGPSSISVQSILSLVPPLPLNFLRGCGLDDEELRHYVARAPDPAGRPTCFISYSHEDSEFARRLRDALQAQGVLCWLDSDDLRIGKSILDSLKEAIDLHDHVLLCCSKSSLASSWVEDEIAMSIEKERSNKSVVLTPLDLDGALQDWESGYAPRLRGRLAANFRNWRDEKAFEERTAQLAKELLQRR